MMKLMTLAALATLALAPAANAQESIRVSLAGKSTAQIHADIVSAAKKVCAKATTSETMFLDAYGRCVKGTVNTALDQLGASEVAQLQGSRVAQR